ncbi:ROK family transcriptional regulator [Puerhibacterium puerhi]|uniref:ROK family transcriptional regulator n=1 Tax=Puerhibacterium puerhi TaxID=2692623 RepID=UPI00135AB9D8|nr:ROK family transcriptional regulator [Puerhibacterium puerhi]
MKQRVDAPASPGAIFNLVRQGIDTRGAIARATGLAASTVSQRVETLLQEGFLEERSGAAPTGGRRARELRVRGDAGVVAAATLGANHARVLLANLSGVPLSDAEAALDVAAGPEAVVAEVWTRIRDALTAVGKAPDDLRGIALGLPAPVDSRTGSVASSVQLPGWDLVAVYELLGAHTQVPALVENDANLLAVAEASLADRGAQHLLAVKIGSRIGSGFISGGTLHQGASGAAGEISHTPTSLTSLIPCSCGTENCLESVASGSAIAARLRAEGRDVRGTADLLELASAGDYEVISALRDAGRLVGEVLAEIVNFLNPHAVVFGGALSAAAPFVAAVRGTLFQRCLPVVTAVLDVRVGRAGRSAEALGGVKLVLERTFTPEAVDQAIARRRSRA